MVIALDKHRKPLGFITERRCRILCEKKRAVLLRRFPCVAIIRDVDARTITDKPRYRIKIDPGSITDGISIIDEAGGRIMFAMHIVHRASNVVSGLKTRAAARRNRRSRETRYRRCKWKNGGTFAQKGNEGRIPPSVRSIIGNTETWVRKLLLQSGEGEPHAGGMAGSHSGKEASDEARQGPDQGHPERSGRPYHREVEPLLRVGEYHKEDHRAIPVRRFWRCGVRERRADEV